MKKTILRNYAKLIARKGANVQKGQEVIIYAELDQPEFVRMVADECYRAGARKVSVEWSDQKLTGIDAKWQDEKTLGTVEKWQKEKLKHMVDVLPCRIFIESEDPDGLSRVPQPKFNKAMASARKIKKPYRDAIDNKHQWTIAAVPGDAWAKKIFPHLTKAKAREKLWEVILKASRATGDPIENWNRHNKDLHDRCDYLNSLGLRKLHYTASNGTDLTVKLLPQLKFQAGSDKTLSGVEYNPNIPSEEVFTSPDRMGTEGIVVASKPLSYMGQLIEGFNIRFEKGKAVEAHAEKNEKLLKEMLAMDDGAAYLGECALVPAGSPIDASGILFFNTLFDENAACHLALGFGFPECVKGFEKMTLDEIHKLGVNDSIIHEDFMIGTKDLNIDGYDASGKCIPIFRKGNWAF